MTTPCLVVEGLNLSFGDRVVLDGLSFEIGSAEVYGLVGPNGSGKSTTINAICGVLSPTEGCVRIGGVQNSVASTTALGVVPQEIGVYRDLTCMQNLQFFAAVYGLSRAAARERAAACLDAVGLADRAESLASELSGGMQRRLHIAMALLHKPALLILDEPTVGLDLEIRHRIWDLVAGLRGEGTAILLTTHHLEEAERVCDRIGIMHQGRIAAEGSMEDLRQLIPAQELAVVESKDPTGVRSRAAELGLPFRREHDATVLWLPQRSDIARVAAMMGDVPLRSLRLRPVGLEDVFTEVVAGGATAS